MIQDKKTTVFNSGCEAIVNTVNCKGVMGAGLALEFRLRFPEMYEEYSHQCRKGLVRIGELIKYECNGTTIISFPTKDHWRDPSEIRYIEEGLDYFRNHCNEWGVKSIAIPPLGCNNGGLDFEIVRPLIHDKLKDLPLEIVLCIDPGFPEGKELEMVDDYNDSNLTFVCDYLSLGGKQKRAITGKGQIKRFFKILEIEGVGITSYEKLFRLFFSEECKNLYDLEREMTYKFNNCNLKPIMDQLSIKGKENKILSGFQGNIKSFCELNESLKNTTYGLLFDYFKKNNVPIVKETKVTSQMKFF